MRDCALLGCSWLIGHGRSRRHCGQPVLGRVGAGSRTVAVCEDHRRRAVELGWAER